MVNRIVVGAHYGLKDWIAQRATAVIMAVYSVILLAAVGAIGPNTYEAWRGLFANGFMKFITFLFFLSCSTTPGSVCVTSGWTTSSPPASAWCCMS